MWAYLFAGDDITFPLVIHAYQFSSGIKILEPRVHVDPVVKSQIGAEDGVYHQVHEATARRFIPTTLRVLASSTGIRRKSSFRQMRLGKRSLVGCFGKSLHPGCQYLSGIIAAPPSENAEGVFGAGREGLHFFPVNFQEGAKP